MQCTKASVLKAPRNYWRSSVNRVRFFESIKERLKITDFRDWYEVTPQQISQHGGATLFSELGGSMYNALRTIYPNYNWLPWKFANVPKYFWKQQSNRKAFFDHVQTELNISSLEDWYRIKSEDIHKQGGGTMMMVYYSDSLYKALSSIYPDYNWLPWRFQHGRVPSGYWNDLSNQRKFFDWAATQLGVKVFSGWYSVSPSQIRELGGGNLLHKYGNSLHAALSHVYPEGQWQAWMFSQVPEGFWDSPENIHQFIRVCGDKLHINQLDDWYRVSLKQLTDLGAKYLVRRYGGLPRVLQMVYPHHSWDFSNTSTKKAAQRWLRVTTQTLFGLSDQQIMEDFPHPLLKGLRMDIWIPSLSLALEYHGEQHFHDLKTFNSQRQYQEKDALKQQLCKANNLHLLTVPYWWDRSQTSLLATVLHEMPHLRKHITPSLLPTTHVDVFVQTHRISDSPPATSLLKKRLMLPREVPIPANDEYQGWWMATQPSGVRLFWDASVKNLFLKSGKEVPNHTLNSLRDSMPPFNVEGFVRSSHTPVFHIMDIPDPNLPVETRLEKIRDYLTQSKPQLLAVPYQMCQGSTHLLDTLQQTTAGVVLKAPGSHYQSGYTNNCVQMKLYQEAEVTMVRVHPPTGHLLCQQDTGQYVFVRCDGDTIANPPSRGTKLIVQYAATSKLSGRLKTPSFKHVAMQTIILPRNETK